jgi:S1-C subfamily serine protease
MIPANVTSRVFHIHFNGATGTAFVLDVDNRQYLVTAKHVMGDLPAGKHKFDMMYNNIWNSVEADLVGHAAHGADISVFALPRFMSTMPLPAITTGMFLAQDVYFLGFPFGDYMDPGAMNNHWPIAIVKRGIISSFNSGGKPSIVMVDGINNPGFSGGPVITRKLGTAEVEYEIVSVVSGYKNAPINVVHHGVPVPDLLTLTNSGLVISYHIMHAVDVARSNPIGYPLPPNS